MCPSPWHAIESPSTWCARSCSFLGGSLSYSQADGIANTLWTVILHAAEPHAPAGEEHFPEPAVSIFEAFDAGEYLRQGDQRDPVQAFTVPRLRELLSGPE